MKGVIYARYSSDNQREESIEGQIRENTAYAEKNGITIVGHYIDRALSAKTDDRPEFQRMIKDSAKHGFDVVIVWKLDRFSRNRYDSAKYKAALRKNGVKVLSATEAIADGTVTLNLGKIKVGSANGEYYEPTEDQTELYQEIGEFYVVEKKLLEDGLTVSFHALIPESFGNCDIREVGLYEITDEGDKLFAISTQQPIVKPGTDYNYYIAIDYYIFLLSFEQLPILIVYSTLF